MICLKTMGAKMNETILSIAKWHEQTFPDATLDKQVEKWYDEQKEFIDSQDPEEFVDMFIVACGIARFSIEKAIPKFAVVFNNLIDEEWGKFQELVNKKMAVNRNRVWASNDGKYQHIEGV